MTIFRAKTIKQIKANEVAPDFAKWCNSRSDCMYKSKKRKFHGWINLTNLSKKDKVAQCGHDNGDCNHTTHYGVGGYHNICPIGGMNGDLPWPAKLQLSNFNFSDAKIKSTSKIKSVTVHLEHRMVALDPENGKKYDNFGPTFHSDGGWALKVYFSNGSSTVSQVKKYNSNPRLSKTKYNSVSYTFKDISISELIKSNFALNIEYNHNYNTEAGIIYLKNVYIDVDYKNEDVTLKGSANSDSLFISENEACRTKIIHTLEASQKLGESIICIEKPKDVSVTEVSSSSSKRKFQVIDRSDDLGKKKIKYTIRGHEKQVVTLTYKANARPKPQYNIIQEYKTGEDYNSSKPYIVFKNGCSSKIRIYVDSINTLLVELPVSNQNSSSNLLNQQSIKAFHDAVKALPCGIHTLYIQRDGEKSSEFVKNKVSIHIKPMNFKFQIYKEDGSRPLTFTQSKSTDLRYEKIYIKRIDDEPKESIPVVYIIDETHDEEYTISNVRKEGLFYHTIDKYYSGEFYLALRHENPCIGIIQDEKMVIESNHKQNFDYLFTRGERGTGFDFDYLVAWEGDNVKEPLMVESVDLKNTIDDIKICSDDSQTGVSKLGYIDLNVSNKTEEKINNLKIELNVLVENEEGELEISTSEFNEQNGIFNQLYNLFPEKNKKLNDNVELLNLTPDNDLVDEENVYLLIKNIDAKDTINIKIPYRSMEERTVFLQYLLFETPLDIHNVSSCEYDFSSDKKELKIEVLDSMLTQLDISGNTDLVMIDDNYPCPNECYTTKDVYDDTLKPVSNPETGGITYKITNIDTVDFLYQKVITRIDNSPEMIPYAYISNGKYHALIDNNGDKIPVQENVPYTDENGNIMYEPLTDSNGSIILDENGDVMYDTTKPLLQENKIQWVYEKKESPEKVMSHQNIFCNISFDGFDDISYAIKTDNKGVANFYIPLPESLNRSYTINELLNGVISFEFKGDRDYNQCILTKTDTTVDYDNNKNKVIMNYGNNYKRYKPGDTVVIPVFMYSKIVILQNYFTFKAELSDSGSYDEVTILYKICNIPDNEGVFKTIFKTDDKRLINNEVSKNIYCGMTSQTDTFINLSKRVIENKDLNILSINVNNNIKRNKDVEVEVDLGKSPLEYLGNYDFIDVSITNGDYSFSETDGKILLNWLIGDMEEFEKESAIIKIQASDVGLVNTKVNLYDYLHKKDGSEIEPKQSPCNKCENKPSYRLQDSLWEEFSGVWYKRFPDGTYKRKVDGEWVDKED